VTPLARILSVGTANPAPTYTQEDILRLFRCDNPTVRRFFESGHIRRRHLVLPEPGPDGEMPFEDSTTLLDKHLRVALEIGPRAIRRALDPLGLSPDDVDLLVTVTSTGMLCPSLSAHVMREMGFPRHTHRADVVGMGCNAGINGLTLVTDHAMAHPGRRAVLLCCEVCSAAYVFDMTVRTGVVNSLFGDGAAAVVVQAHEGRGPEVLGFESHIIHEAGPEMRFDLVDGRYSFYLGWEIPYLIGEEVALPVDRLLTRFGLRRRDVDHWIVHSGGKKVVDAVKYNLGLTEHDVRHTRSVLRNFGNLSSGSYLFSYQELLREGVVRPGDRAVAMAMGPGVSIECALLQW